MMNRGHAYICFTALPFLCHNRLEALQHRRVLARLEHESRLDDCLFMCWVQISMTDAFSTIERVEDAQLGHAGDGACSQVPVEREGYYSVGLGKGRGRRFARKHTLLLWGRRAHADELFF